MSKFDLYSAVTQNRPYLNQFSTVWDWEREPLNLLYSYAYRPPLDAYTNPRADETPPRPRQSMLDSGAFTMWSTGREFTVDQYIEYIREVGADTFTEIIGLDKVGDAEFTLKNCRKMRDALGRDVVPVFHIGEDFKWLKRYAKEFDKVGLSCRFGESFKQSHHFYDSCFYHAWPCKFHSFGWATEEVLSRNPFQSADSSSFMTSGLRYGNWKSLKKIGRAHV